MINSQELFKLFIKNKINFFSGVPDSILKDFLNILELKKKLTNITCVNEGSAWSQDKNRKPNEPKREKFQQSATIQAIAPGVLHVKGEKGAHRQKQPP